LLAHRESREEIRAQCFGCVHEEQPFRCCDDEAGSSMSGFTKDGGDALSIRAWIDLLHIKKPASPSFKLNIRKERQTIDYAVCWENDQTRTFEAEERHHHGIVRCILGNAAF